MNTNEYRKLHKNAKKCMRLAVWIGVLITLLILAVVWYVMYDQGVGITPEPGAQTSGKGLPLHLHLLLGAAAAALVIYALVSPSVRYRRYSYLIDAEKVIVVEGLWFITREMAPIERIHQITVKSGPIDRLYGLAKVIAITAGGTVTIRFLETALAEEIAGGLQSQIREIIAEQKAEEEVKQHG